MLSNPLRAVLILAVSSWLMGACAVRAQADLSGKRAARQWETVEWAVDNPTWEGNPFDVGARVAFVHADSGQRDTTGMFYDGAQCWKFRFTGTRPGEWHFISQSPDSHLDGVEGTVTVVPNPEGVGFMVPARGKWCRQVGVKGAKRAFVPQLVMYTDDIRGLWEDPERIARDIENLLGRHGFTGLHVPSIGGRWFDIESGPEVNPQMKNPDPRTFQALEGLISRVHRAGGLVHIWPWGDRQRRWTPTELEGGMNGPIDRRLQRYIAARLGPLPGWSMGYGFDLQEWAPGPVVEEWHDYMHEQMGWFHFLGGRAGGPTRGADHSRYVAFNLPLDYAGYQHWQPGYHVYAAALRAIPGKPVMSEDRFRIRGKYPNKDYTEVLTRRGLYASTMAGGVGNIWGYLKKPDGRYESGGMSFDYSHPEWIKTCTTFFFERGRFLLRMERANDLSDGFCLKTPECGGYVLYKEEADTLRVDLSGACGPLPTIAVDTRRPYEEVALGELPAEEQTIELPRKSDWAVAVGDFTAEGSDQAQME